MFIPVHIATLRVEAPAQSTGMAATSADRVTVYDVSELDLLNMVRDHGYTWAVIRIAPARTLPTFSLNLDPNTGKLKPLSEQVRTEGTFTVTVPITHRLRVGTWQYSFATRTPGVGAGRVLLDHMLYSPFTSGGTVVCHIHTAVVGMAAVRSEQLVSPYLVLPAAWAVDVQPALRSLGSYSGSFVRDTPGNAKLLRHMTQDRNPLIALEAWRKLAEAGMIDASFVKEALHTSDVFLQAAFVWTLLRNWERQLPEQRTLIDQALAALVTQANTALELRGLALGASVDPEVSPEAKALVEQLKQRQVSFDFNGPADEYINSLHAYLHRKEGDLSNAGYWYRRAGQPVAEGPLDAEWEAIAEALLATEG